MAKTIRFGDLVRQSGRPHPVTLWVEPKQDPAFSKAIRENRVLTIHSDPASHKKDYGEIGFRRKKGDTYLVFPEPLPKEQARVIGINYLLSEEPETSRGLAPSKGKAKKRKEKPEGKHVKLQQKPELKSFEVLVRRTAVLEDAELVKAESEAGARELVLHQVKKKRFDVARGIVRTEIINVDEKG